MRLVSHPVTDTCKLNYVCKSHRFSGACNLSPFAYLCLMQLRDNPNFSDANGFQPRPNWIGRNFWTESAHLVSID